MQLHYRKYGQGQAVIILHGLFGSGDNWNTIAKKLSENNLLVYAVDLRNHGLSPHHPEMNLELMAKDVKELIDTENINFPIMTGHSMGGKVAMYFDYLFPDTLKKLIVVDIAPKKYPPGHTDVFQALNAVDFNVVKTRKDVEIILRKHLHDESVIQFLLKNVYWEKNNQLNWRFNLSAIQNHYEEILKEIPLYNSTTPALFIRGEKSTYISDDDMQNIKQRYLNTELITISDAGHWIHAEQPQKFLNTIIKFIEK